MIQSIVFNNSSNVPKTLNSNQQQRSVRLSVALTERATRLYFNSILYLGQVNLCELSL